MNDKIRKYIVPNIPYLFICWIFLKLGTAYRMAPGADFAHKLTGIMQTIGPAFQNIAPGLVGFDWLIGIAGAVIIRLVVWNKAKKAKKFRRDIEYGSARWGTEKDIKPFVDPVFKNNVILTGPFKLCCGRHKGRRKRELPVLDEKRNAFVLRFNRVYRV